MDGCSQCRLLGAAQGRHVLVAMKSAGFTLIELMVTIVILTLFIVGVAVMCEGLLG